MLHGCIPVVIMDNVRGLVSCWLCWHSQNGVEQRGMRELLGCWCARAQVHAVFESILDWGSFSLRVAERDIEKVSERPARTEHLRQDSKLLTSALCAF